MKYVAEGRLQHLDQNYLGAIKCNKKDNRPSKVVCLVDHEDLLVTDTKDSVAGYLTTIRL